MKNLSEVNYLRFARFLKPVELDKTMRREFTRDEVQKIFTPSYPDPTQIFIGDSIVEGTQVVSRVTIPTSLIEYYIKPRRFRFHVPGEVHLATGSDATKLLLIAQGINEIVTPGWVPLIKNVNNLDYTREIVDLEKDIKVQVRLNGLGRSERMLPENSYLGHVDIRIYDEDGQYARANALFILLRKEFLK